MNGEKYEEYKEYIVRIKKYKNMENGNNTNENQKRLEINRKEYLELFKKEYEFERIKKQSFESRAGLILTILATLFTFLFEKLGITSDFIEIIKKDSLTILLGIKFLNIILIIVFLGFTVNYLIKIINVQSHNNYDIDSEIDYTEEYSLILKDLLYNHKLIINSFRSNNEKKAEYFRHSLKHLIFTFILFIIYAFLKEV
ncbi:MAG: hypothetical protein SOY60_05000 [Fusobacterium gastrosuis]|uniref:hypothetical protein n=1 Tax=Fusobacterium gastrosuis TaxID=1755100 RepID=UPI00297A9C8D|nr:hypothetical protein [Fusobacteriaceae bacterium]MDY4011003.1 hypothetical protein [Fusobacterium gastrosuis]MDY5713545.1 hypothetical protein [Fusobacterium gastrosuis]